MIGRTLWYIVAPVYWPAPGGGAVYTKLLAEALADDGADVVVATEAFPDTERREVARRGSGTLVVDRLFPLRAGRAELDWRSYTAYAWQNMLMLQLPGHLADTVRKTAAERAVVLIQSSFFNKPSLMPSIIKRMALQLPDTTRLIVDVRDPLFGQSSVQLFARFDAVIGCSQAISDRLRAVLPDHVEVVHLPIPFEAGTSPDEGEVTATLSKFGINGVPYVLNPNGVLEAKRYPEMLDVIRELRRIPGHEGTVLVTIGRSRDWKARDDAAVAEGILKYVGVVPNRTALALAKGAKAVMILSMIEGMPRSSLETLALGKPLIGPPVPELIQHVPTSVVQSSDPVEIARQIVRVCEQSTGERYPVEIHSMASLLASYRALEPQTSAN